MREMAVNKNRAKIVMNRFILASDIRTTLTQTRPWLQRLKK
jgi:hypothetical protein